MTPLARRTRALGMLLVAAAVSQCGGGGTTITICAPDTGDYTLDSVRLVGPAGTSPVQLSGSGSFTATWFATVNSTAGTVCPLGDLVDEDGFLRFDDDLLATFAPSFGTTPTIGPKTGTAVFSLQCTDGEVEGPSGGSGEGSREFFLAPVDEAEVVALIKRRSGSPSVRSNAIDVSCS